MSAHEGPAGLAPVPGEVSRVTLARVMEVMDANTLGNVHGGVIMRAVDNAAGAAAVRHCGTPAVTASMDEMAFLEPVRIGDILVTEAQVTWTGRTSLEVGVRVTSSSWRTAEDTHVASAYLVFVPIDAEGRPLPVPPLDVVTDLERRRWREAEIRRASRLERREAIRRLRERGLED